MIGLKGTLNVIDNSGALIVECIRVLKNKSSMGFAGIGDEIVVVVKKAKPISQTALSPSASASSALLANKCRRGDVRRAVVVRTKKATQRPDGRHVRFDDNAAVLINHKRDMVGNRITGVVAQELRKKGWARVLSLAPKIV